MNKGDKAPQFQAKDIYGADIKLADIKGRKILFSFLRTAACPFCNLRVHELEKKQAIWKKKGLVTITVFASSTDEILQYAGKQQPSFIVLADPTENLYRSYGIGYSLAGKFKAMLRMKTIFKIMAKGFFNLKALTDKSILTGDFLINEKGEVDVAYYGRDFGDHLSFERIDEWLEISEIKKTEYAKRQNYI